ncbi:DNA mismatch repair protein-like protein pms1 [Macroventuria anomochaeta]|uniref:DNA mismatch repair protein-like protein pms1 n=1 Tax=Macroventuria anomochaeta TaxID=301207 RepID=A0ACB6S529_9PLEO|nr:DNA mismatch repair protein-like protein pms1 [Macroventuria anomochaeta]KAF2629148.1 DNA mismatch repair protein-like protein pms1 [Macroventuria anomochaeta]
MATIKPIEGRSVHQIQSGQVIVDLQSVCKELVENSIDAGATSIEVRFKNNGLDTIEVQDNGGGIAPADYDTIALKHYTSKLSTYDDLSSLKTFGFRGEALSSLCALSKFHIVTARASDGPKGTKLDFEQSGKLKGTSVVAARQGTIVVVETLFYNLPVRRKELEKNIKREYNKVLALLNAYACISVGVKFSVTNLMPKGKKTIAFSTNANPSTRGNISNVYGAKTIAALIPLDLDFRMDPSNRPGATQSAKNSSPQEDSGSRKVRVVGHISRPVVGEGRQTPDRQMFFVNSRPCNLPQVAKAFNEVYKSYNITQSPFIFADIQLDTEAYDVNVSPDKRTIMLHDQTALLERVKESLAELFAGHDQSVPQAQLLGKQQSTFRPPSMQPRGSTLSIAGDDRGDAGGAAEARPDSRKRSSVPTDTDVPNGVLPGFVKASLIESFAERDAEDRVVRRPPRRRRSSSPEHSKVIEERVFHPNVRRRSATPEADQPSNEPRPRSESPLFEPEQPISPSRIRLEPPSKAVQDFNARIASMHARRVERERSPRSPGPTPADAMDDEEPIPAIKQTPQKVLSQSSIQNAFDRMRPMRTPIQQATITVGDTTTTTTIGSGSQYWSSKRSRIYTPKFSLTGTPLNQNPKVSLFTNSLRGFAAPGTQAEGSEEEEDDDQDSSMPMAIRTPSRQMQAASKAVEEPRTDDLMESSSAPPPGEPFEEEPLDGNSVVPDAKEAESFDGEYVDEEEKKVREEARIARLIAEAEKAAARPIEINLKRANKLFKTSHNKHSTIHLERVVETKVTSIARHLRNIQLNLDAAQARLNATAVLPTSTQLNKDDPEERLSLTVTKTDFNKMQIIGQFNLGFIIAVRPPTSTSPTSDLFIIDQHASDEKYNFERLSTTTMLVSQRLVHPHPLELTAVEEEIILANEHSLTANGFVVEVDTSNKERRAKLTSLPMSKEVTFTPTDLEELLALVMDNPPSSSTPTSPYIPRPSKVRKLLASRACRSSVMIGKTLQNMQMENIVRHMGSMDKPWSCPHGRPTMRHLYGLEKWEGWNEGDGVASVRPASQPTARNTYKLPYSISVTYDHVVTQSYL